MNAEDHNQQLLPPDDQIKFWMPDEICTSKAGDYFLLTEFRAQHVIKPAKLIGTKRGDDVVGRNHDYDAAIHHEFTEKA